MTQTQHTAGPWKTEEAPDGKWIQVYGNGSEPDQNIAEVRRDDFIGMTEDGDEPLANACLIAAAPELLEALKLAEHWMRDPDALKRSHNYDQETVDKIIGAAIAKARGQS